MTTPTVTELLLPAAGDLSWEQYAGRACVWCDRPITRGGRSVGIASGRMGADVLDIEVYAGPVLQAGGTTAMTTMSGIRFCCICDRPIAGKAQKVEQFSASGARPDKLRHPPGDPACRPHC